jgi:hypothetical protein
VTFVHYAVIFLLESGKASQWKQFISWLFKMNRKSLWDLKGRPSEVKEELVERKEVNEDYESFMKTHKLIQFMLVESHNLWAHSMSHTLLQLVF